MAENVTLTLQATGTNESKAKCKKGFIPVLQTRTRPTPEITQDFAKLQRASKHPIGQPKEQAPQLSQMEAFDLATVEDVIAFPKTQTGADLMTEAPSPVNNGQLNELHLRITDTQ